MSIINVQGQQFGRLTVIERVPNQEGIKGALWRCRCECGNETIALGKSLRRGEKLSCGCLKKKSYQQETKYCEYCGEPLTNQGRRFCSQSCSAKARYSDHKVEVDEDFPWKQTSGLRWKCRYQPKNVSCTDRDCANCGWNPEVAKRRLAQTLKKMKEATV